MTKKKDQAAQVVEFFQFAPLTMAQTVFGIARAIMKRRENADPPTKRERARVNNAADGPGVLQDGSTPERMRG